ncbi:CHAT domain protein [Polystyrenella longa]|uniref:CHAT domain protein n=1 Tax=Polystyrenella longa TaxID=2528007 RepID=A0A518CLN0_9PLAN|nr:CHAT domain-containing protein [Polystyrenella longa]QDU80132.1 CHAT domain protein [Polystyrenella longa]
MKQLRLFLVYILSVVWLPTVVVAEVAPPDSNPLLEYVSDNIVGLVLVRPHSLIQDTEQEVLGDIPYLGQFPIPPSEIENIAVLFRMKPGGGASPAIAIHFRREFPRATLTRWLAPNAKLTEHSSGLPYYEATDDVEEGIFGLRNLIFPSATTLILSGDDPANLLNAAEKAERGRVYNYASNLNPNVNFAAMIDVGQLRMFADVAPPFAKMKSIRQVMTIPSELSVASLESVFGKQSNEMTIRLIPRDNVQISDQPAVEAIAAWAQDPEQLVREFLASLSFYQNPSQPDELIKRLQNQLELIAQFAGAFEPSKDKLVLINDSAPSFSRALSSTSNLLAVAVQMARESARLMQLTNNYKQVMLAWHNYADLQKKLPKDLVDANGNPLLSWRVQILPHLGLEALYQQFKLDEPWNSEHNRQLLTQVPLVYQDIWNSENVFETRVQGITGDGTVLTSAEGLSDVTDGLSNTIALTEAEKPVPWTQPADLSLQSEMSKQLHEHGSQNILGFMDGSVRFSQMVPDDFYQNLFSINDGNDIDYELLNPSESRIDEQILETYSISQPEVPEVLEQLESDRYQTVYTAFWKVFANKQLFVGSDEESAPSTISNIMLAWHIHHDLYAQFPPDIATPDKKAGLSWRVRILPMLEEQELYDQFHFDEPWDSEHNKQLIEKMPAVFRDSEQQLPAGMTRVVSVQGKGTVFTDRVDFNKITDGTSMTGAIVEANEARPWTKPDDLTLSEKFESFLFKTDQGNHRIGMIDGSHHHFPPQSDEQYKNLFLYADGGPEKLNMVDENGQKDQDNPSEQVLEIASRMLKNENPYIQSMGVRLFWAFESTPHSADENQMRHMLNHEENLVRLYSRDHVPQLVSLLFMNEDEFNRERMVMNENDSEANELIVYLFHPSQEIARRASLLIGETGNADVLAELKQLLTETEASSLVNEAIATVESRLTDQPEQLSLEEKEDLITQREQMRNEAIQFLQNKQPEDGLALLTEVLQIERKLYGDDGSIPLDTNEWVINNASRLGYPNVTTDQQRIRAEMTLATLGPDDPQVRIDQRLVDVYARLAEMTVEELEEYNSVTPQVQQVKTLIQENKLAEAIPLLEANIEVRSRLLGSDSVMIVADLRELRQLLFRVEEYQKAFEVADRLTTISTAIFGSEAKVVQSDRSERAYLQQYAGRPEGVIDLLIELQEIPEKQLDVPTAAQDSRFIGLRKLSEGEFETGIKYLKRSFRLFDQINNQDRTGEIANVIGDHLQKAGSKESLAWFTDSIWRYQKVNPYQGYYANYPALATQMHQSGQYHLEMTIRKALTEALREGLASQKVGQLNFVKTLPPLARTYIELGDYEMADKVLRECVTQTGDYRDDPFVIEMLTCQAEVNDYFGEHETALQLYNEALEQSKKPSEPFLAYFPSTLKSLAEHHLGRGQLDEALVFAESASDILSTKENLEYVKTVALVARISLKTGNLDNAKEFVTIGTGLLESKQFSAHDEISLRLIYADLWLQLTDLEKASTYATEAVDLALQEQGEDSLPYCRALETLSRVYLSTGDQNNALQSSLKALNNTRRLVERSAYLLSPRQQMLYSNTMRSSLDLFLTIAVPDPNSASLCYDQILQWKGSGLVRQRTIHQRAKEANVAPFYIELDRLSTKLATVSRPSSNQNIDRIRQLDQLTQFKDLLESQLSAARIAYMDLRNPVTLADFMDSIPEEATFVDYFVYQPQNAEVAGEEEPIILATLIQQNGNVEVFPLDRLNRVKEALSIWRSTLGTSPDSKQAGDLLRTILWDPLVPKLAQPELILISPDGILAQLPFHALPTVDGKQYLIEQHKLSVIPVPQLLVQRNEPTQDSGSGNMLLVGDVSYDQTPNEGFVENVLNRSLHTDSHFAPLPGTRDEINAISTLFQQGHPEATAEQLQQLAQTEASELAFRKQIANCSQVHIATHGYFIDDNEATGSNSLRRFNPGLMSGLAFAGANNRDHEENNDGLLTADEIVNLDMEHVNLAVLSACETGLGEVIQSEGLIGIQRSFQVAGTGATITSLWQVPDQATRVLMERFYRNYWEKKMSRLDALREAQIFLLNTPEAIDNPELVRGDRRVRPNQPAVAANRLNPESWAAFVLSGDWR